MLMHISKWMMTETSWLHFWAINCLHACCCSSSFTPPPLAASIKYVSADRTITLCIMQLYIILQHLKQYEQSIVHCLLQCAKMIPCHHPPRSGLFKPQLMRLLLLADVCHVIESCLWQCVHNVLLEMSHIISVFILTKRSSPKNALN